LELVALVLTYLESAWLAVALLSAQLAQQEHQ
jgi:hypothetical protein